MSIIAYNLDRWFASFVTRDPPSLSRPGVFGLFRIWRKQHLFTMHDTVLLAMLKADHLPAAHSLAMAMRSKYLAFLKARRKEEGEVTRRKPHIVSTGVSTPPILFLLIATFSGGNPRDLGGRVFFSPLPRGGTYPSSGVCSRFAKFESTHACSIGERAMDKADEQPLDEFLLGGGEFRGRRRLGALIGCDVQQFGYGTGRACRGYGRS